MITTPPLPAKEYMPFAVAWTRADCDKLEAAGVLDYHYELIEGVIIRKMGQHLPHALTVSKAQTWLTGYFGYEYVLSQTSIAVAAADNTTSRPEPDIVVLNKPGTSIPASEPRPEDIALILEVSDTTLDYDLQTKAALYGRAGIAQYMVLSIAERVVYVHTNTPSGVYQRITCQIGESLTILAAPHLAITVDDLLLPVTSG